MGGSAAIASDLSFLIILPLLACCSSSLLALLGLRQRDTRKSNWERRHCLVGPVMLVVGVSPPIWVWELRTSNSSHLCLWQAPARGVRDQRAEIIPAAVKLALHSGRAEAAPSMEMLTAPALPTPRWGYSPSHS